MGRRITVGPEDMMLDVESMSFILKGSSMLVELRIADLKIEQGHALFRELILDQRIEAGGCLSLFKLREVATRNISIFQGLQKSRSKFEACLYSSEY
jgi:hypothetical protein